MSFALLSINSWADNLYWVGGSGNFNDANHWSRESGGIGGAKSPTAADNVFFDDNSFSSRSVIDFIGQAEVNDITFSKYTAKVIFSGLQNEKIIVHGDLQLNAYIDNQFQGDIWLVAAKPATSVFFSLATCKGNVYFNGATNWNLQGKVITENTGSVYLKQGIFNINDAGIFAGNIIASSGVTINSNHGTFSVKDKIIIPNGVIFNDVQSDIFAYTKDAAKFPVASSISFNSSSRLHNLNNVTVCAVTNTGHTDPTCSGACNGNMTFNIPAICTSNPVYAVWNTGGGSCTTIPTGTLTPGTTYTVGGICGCGTQYSVIFTNDPTTQDSTYAQFNISIADPIPAKVNSFILRPPTCFGYCNGKVIAVLNTFGQLPINLAWTTSNPVSTFTHAINNHTKDTVYNACAGSYTVVLTDANGCVSTASVTVLPQPTDIVSSITTTSVACSGVCSGVITNAPVGGTGALSCTLNGAAMAGCTASGLCGSVAPGTTYTVITTDANGCKDTVHPVIVAPTPISFTKNPVSGILNINCNNICNGSVGITGVTGGAGGYTYSWAPAGGAVSGTATSSTYSGLCGSAAGTTYTCTIKDANNCSTTATFTVVSPPALTHTITGTNPKCNVGPTGSATVTEGGGSAPYTFTWTPSGTISGASPISINSTLNGGTYTVHVTDNKGCLDSATVVLTPPLAVTATITTTTNPTCPNLNNGKLCVTAGGGTPGYTYAWSPTGGNASCTPATLTVTAGGTSNYQVTVTDANGCTVNVTGTMTSPPQATVTAAVTNPSCGAAPCTGSATLTPSGGTGPFTYVWSCSGSVTNTISGQCGGTSCNYTVTDAATNCKYTGTVSFTVAPVLSVNISATALNCSNSCNSVITSTVSGGTLNYSYSWNGTGANPVVNAATNQVNMCAGSYSCQVTDANGCVQTATVAVAAPPQLTVTLVPTQPTCTVLCNGSILATPSGGTGPYPGVSWLPSVSPNPPGTLNPTGLCGSVAPGTTYTLTITDSKGCTGTNTVTITSPTSLTVTLTSTSVTCTGLCNGTATAAVAGGTSPYTYSWDNAAFTATNNASGLCVGSHTLIVKDANACVATTQIFNIVEPNPISTSVINIVNTCGACSGSATANPSGGTAPYTYTWTPVGGNAVNDPGLCVGNYTLMVGDANGCPPATATFTISPIVTIAIAASSQSVSCNNGCDGSANATASNGQAPYNMVWTSSPTYTVSQSCAALPSPATCTATALCPGTYVITATDVNGCVNKDSVTIGNPPALTVIGTQTNVKCFGTCTGSATVTPAGGSGVYTITWADGPVGSPRSNMCPGTYTANIVDSKGCPATKTFTITSNPQFTVSSVITAPLACGGLTGNITATASGGLAGYTFAWLPAGGTQSGASPNSTYSNIPANIYTVTVTDANGCDTTVQIGLSDPGSPTVSAVTSSVTCNGGNNGSATVTAVGIPAITVTWPGGIPTGPSPLTVPNLTAGVYVVQATDGNGCNAFSNVTVIEPNPIQDHSTLVQPNCGAGGSITLAPTGGGGPAYTYSWIPGGSTVNPYTNVPAGVDTCIVTDGTGCTKSFTYTLNPASSLTVALTQNNTLCSYTSNGSASAVVSGGTPAYSYTWTSSAGTIASGAVTNVSNLAAGNYTLNVSDQGGCTSQQTFTITSAPVILPNLVKVNNLCNAGCTGTATVTPSGGTGALTVNWTPGSFTTTTVSNLCPNNYTVVVTDGNSCTDTTTFTIVAPPTLTATIASTNPTCFGVCNGSATVTPSGGTGTPATYTVGWSPNVCVNCPVASNLCGGIPYTITVTDSNACVNSQILNLVSPTQISAATTLNDPLCFNNSNGSIVSTPTGGTPGYTFSWSPAIGSVTSTAATSTYSNLPAGTTFTLIVTDALGCTDTSTQVLTNPGKITTSYSSTDASCGLANGSITISSVSGGSGPITVNWLSPVICGSSLSCNNLAFGTYSFVATDGNGCKDTSIVAVSNPNGPNIDSVVVNDLCNGVANGSIAVTVISGINHVTPYVFTWTPPVTVTTNTNSTTNSNLPTGQYICTVVDSLGCGTATTFTITQPPVIQDNGNSTNATCVGINDATITSVASGGTGTTYTYTLDGITTNTTGIFVGVSAGPHTVCISDSVGCQKCFPYTINPSFSILSTVTSVNNICSNNCSGSITLSNISNGTAPYSITWNNAQTGPVISNLCVGSYTATITDAAGCQAIDTALITAPSAIVPHDVTVSPACGLCNGTISVAPSGGTPGTITSYTYQWSTGSTASNISNVCAGLYQIDITDSLGCKQTVQIPVSNPGAPAVTVTATSPICGNVCSGSLSTSVVGGTVPYSYLWLPGGQTSSSITNQCAGNYAVQVKDSAGCIATVLDTVKPGVVLLANATVVNPGCNICNGSITTNISGSAGPFTYTWSANAGGVTTPNIINACAGAYTVFVTDVPSGCVDTIPVGLNSAANGPILVPTSVDALCNGTCLGTASVSASNGLAPYTYSWSNGQTTSGIDTLCPNVYVVTVTDFNGCITTASVTVSAPPKLVSSLPIVAQPKCFNDCNGSINTVVSGGTPVYTYTWSPATVVGSGGNNLCAGNYSLTVTDANGCTVTAFDTLINPVLLSLTGTVTPTSCNNTLDGAINTSTSGGSPVYTYTWTGSSSATTATLTAIGDGNYTVVVSDSKNCKDTVSFVVTPNINIGVNAGNDTTLCSIPTFVLHGDTTGATSMQWIQLPNPPLNVIGSTLTLTVSPVAGDTTQYVLIAQNGACANSDTINIISNSLPIPDAGNPVTIFSGQSAGIGGSPTNPGGGTINWFPHSALSDTAVGNPTATPTITTTYTVFVTNVNGCVGWDTVTVIVLPTFVIPNGFSPNGDGYNDSWQIDYMYMFPNCEVEVYNRWGEQLFYSKGYATPWNGKYQGKDVPVGTYYYVIRLNDKKFPDHFAGPLTILR